MIDVGFRVLNRFHRAVVRCSRGRVGTRAFGMPIVELRTRGRYSGLIRSTMLTVPIVEDNRYVLVASKGGDDRDPQWYRNLLVTPEVDLLVGDTLRHFQARAATTFESDQLWPRVVTAFGPYGEYRRRAHREIPLVICEPIGETPD